MRILDANIFLRNLTSPRTTQDAAMHAVARALFDRVADGAENVTTIETVLHEVFYALCSNTGYALSHAEAVRVVRPVVGHRGFHIARKAMVLQAIQIFERNPKLDFTDCLLAVHASEDGHELTTFDRDLAIEAGAKVFGA